MDGEKLSSNKIRDYIFLLLFGVTLFHDTGGMTMTQHGCGELSSFFTLFFTLSG